MRVLAALLALAVGCGGGTGDPEPTPPEPEDGIAWGDEVVCAEPVAGFDRLEYHLGSLSPVPATAPGECIAIHGALVAEDLDDDGDIDLALGQSHDYPLIFANDGGEFSHQDEPDWTSPIACMHEGVAAVDLDDDRLPELVLVGDGFVAVAKNLGGLRWGPAELVIEEVEYPHGCLTSVTAGDVDGDGDLDLYIPGSDVIEGPGMGYSIDPTQAAPDWLLLNDGGELTVAPDLLEPVRPRIALFGHFTDFDADGDVDLLVPPDRQHVIGGGTVDLFENDGDLREASAEHGADVPMLGGMGVASADLNGDGELDYCFSDARAVLSCLVSSPFGYIESAEALGLRVTWPGAFSSNGGEPGYNGWSLELVDLDADGWLDLAMAAGHPDWVGNEGDARFRGGPDGFVEQPDPFLGTALRYHSALAAADFSGDGYPDLVFGHREGAPTRWDNPCGDGGWIHVELHGPAGNPRGLGARVTVELPERTEIREVAGPRGWGQSPAALHVGLGAAETAELHVRWPDGTEQSAEVPKNRPIRVWHPDALR
jgi:hypothetical protein